MAVNFNWGQIGQVLGGITTALNGAGVTGAAQTSILGQIGALMNPGETTELQLCAQLLQFTNNPAIEAELAMKLATTYGVSPTVASMAMSLVQPGTDVITRVMQIETLVKAGG